MLYHNNSLIKTFDTQQFTSENNLWIGTLNNNGSTSQGLQGKIYSCKIWDNGTLIRNYIPCKRNSDNKIGMYDIVNDTFSSSANNYNFIAGSEAIIPNPDYPQTINNVTGDVEVVVTNGKETTDIDYKSQTFLLTLGNMELCKIGDYQDYFYKDSGKWYLHKEIGKVTLNGTENWVQDWTGSTQHIFKNTDYLSDSKRFSTATQNIICKSNYFIATHFDGGTGSMWSLRSNDNYPYLIAITDKTTEAYVGAIYIKDVDIDNLNDFKAWLSTHNTTVYYILNTATNTEITDTTLISQLEAINNAISYEGQTNISNNSMKSYTDEKIVALRKGNERGNEKGATSSSKHYP